MSLKVKVIAKCEFLSYSSQLLERLLTVLLLVKTRSQIEVEVLSVPVYFVSMFRYVFSCLLCLLV